MKKLLFAGLIAGTALASCQPNPYEISREAVIEAPAAVIFDQINDHRKRDAWSPWDMSDPDMEKTYEGPATGEGSKYSWKGNEEVGTGSLEILESVPHSFIKSKLTFLEPFESESIIMWNLEPVEGGTRATWTIQGELPGYMFWMGEEDMEEMMGPDFESGLAMLKTIAEGLKRPAYMAQQVDVESMDYYYTEHTIAISDMSEELYASHYRELMGFLGEDAAKMTSPPFSIFHKWDEEAGETHFEIAVAAKSKKAAKGPIKKGKTYAGPAFMVEHRGAYEDFGQAHTFLHDHIAHSGYEIAGSPWEVYITDPEHEPDQDKWITEIYYPVAARAEQP